MFECLRSYMIHEDNLVNQRTSWFLTLNSFLFASAALVFSADASKLAFDKSALDLFILMLALIGMVSSVVALLAVSAAYASTKALKDIWVDKYEPLCKDLGLRSRHRPVDEYDFENVKKIKFRNDPTRPLPYLKGGGGRFSNARKGRYLANVMPIMIGMCWLLLFCVLILTSP